MIGYASRTGTRRNLDALHRAGWRLMISAHDLSCDARFPHAFDNGAWRAFQRKQPFDDAAFFAGYLKFGPSADFFVLPDIVAGGAESLEFSMSWRSRLGPVFHCQPLFAVQDGMAPATIAPLVGPQLGIFIGGTTEWKKRTAEAWGKVAHAKHAYLHVGRVNSAKRIALCAAAGADSFDGSSVSRYAVTLPKLDLARRQPDLFPPQHGRSI